jgi:hypothetical protein
MTKGTGQSTSAAASPRSRTSPLLLLAAWLVPGLGHFILGKRRRALVFFAVVVCAFVTGVLVDGELGTPRPGEPFSWLATLACVGNGLLYVGRLIWINGGSGALGGLPFGLDGGGDPIAVGFSYGNTFLYTGGLMNLLLMLDVSDIARGEKD